MVSISTLYISCLPKYPSGPDDNFQILQPIRHLTSLCAERRLVIPVDRNNDVNVTKCEIISESGEQIFKTLPGIIPYGAKSFKISTKDVGESIEFNATEIENIIKNKVENRFEIFVLKIS